MAITFEEFIERATALHGERWAAEHGPTYGRLFASEAREMAAAASDEDAAALQRVADLMDPDLRQEVPNAAPR
jgi:hypothetical protein